MLDLTARYPAILLGLAVGDALGQPFEKCAQSDPKLLWWDGKYRDSKDHPWNHGLEAGQWTDDTQMTLACAKVVLESKGGIPSSEEFARAYLDWWEGRIELTGKPRGAGRATTKALEAFKNTGRISPDADSLGTGPVMRCAPIFMAYSWDSAVMTVQNDAGATHGHPDIVPSLILFGEHLCSILEALDTSRGRMDPDETKRGLCYGPYAGKTKPGGKMQLIQSAVDSAFACFARTDTFAAAVQMAIRLGGDTDTVASLTGALAGAWYGVEGIPDEYLSSLEKKDDLIAVGVALAEKRMKC